MIRNVHLVHEWEKRMMAGEKPDLFRNLRLFEALYEEARLLGVLPGKNPLEGIEHKIRLARKINVSIL